MSCPEWNQCDKKACIEQEVCMGDYWVEYWKNKVNASINPDKSNPCPFVHLCTRPSCRKESMCQDKTFWSYYHRKKQKKIDDAVKVVNKSKKREQKEQKNIIGQKKYHWIQKQETLRDLYKDIPPCVHNGQICDKMEACSILSQCIITISRFKDKPALIEALRGPKTAKEVINILLVHDPKPMISYYPLKKKK